MATIFKDFEINKALSTLGVKSLNMGSSTGINCFANGTTIKSYSPIDGVLIGEVVTTTPSDYKTVIATATKAFKIWKEKPAPFRGEVVRQFGLKLRAHKEALAKLVTYEMGKSYQEALGEVQEMIDICDFAVGLSRQLHGLTMHSERPGHRMYEQYHALGIVGIISAFNFPVAVWAWNTALAWICGDVCVWKPSEKTPLCGIACQNIAAQVFKDNDLPEGISCLVSGDFSVGALISNDVNIPLVSATGSTKMGKTVAQTVAARLGKSLLELGGNNAMIITPDADIKMAIMGALFGAVGTAGQRCTTTRRLIVHELVYKEVKTALIKAYKQIEIGNPLDQKNHMGPLIDQNSVSTYSLALENAKAQGCKVLVEGGVLVGNAYHSGCYVKPAIIEALPHLKIVHQETFAPILYLIKYSAGVEEAIDIQNSVSQGLSSSIMTNNLREAERFLSVTGSDCGIANVNIGTSGAEIGGAFGGEKDTGGGRESGSDAWKVYMRRQTNTINYTTNLPLSQGIKFSL